ncbi:MAG: uracil-DNA glycosylase [Candidatus Altiarchaeota archaeon]|nr:uracil-DNA glycosylase [Candidatus Altiarchaeota archaeon]
MEEKLRELEEKIRECTRCSLSETRKNPVPGEGDINAKIMLVGLGPGYHENLQGKPFVGSSGKFLNELLKLARLKREEVYITNVIKCYLPDNKPTPEQIKACSPYLDLQIELINPETILTLGNVATSHISQKFNLGIGSIGRAHGSVFEINTLLLHARIIPMYHPASALYNPGMRETLRDDWKNLRI